MYACTYIAMCIYICWAIYYSKLIGHNKVSRSILKALNLCVLSLMPPVCHFFLLLYTSVGSLPYKLYLEQLHLLPLMYINFINSMIIAMPITFLWNLFITSCDMQQFVQITSNNTRSAAAHKLVQSHSHILSYHHFYLSRIVRYRTIIQSLTSHYHN